MEHIKSGLRCNFVLKYCGNNNLYSNTPSDNFSIYLVKITFKHLSFLRKSYLTCRKSSPPPTPGIKVLHFSFFQFILNYKYKNNLFYVEKTSYIEALPEIESDFRFVDFLYAPCIIVTRHVSSHKM